MKRRNADCGKLRRPIKRTKITDGFYGSTLLYLKFFILWAVVLLADFILEFRFEFLWPFWLLLRSVYDSFKYQGLAFSVFFVCIAVTSDMICFFFIPVQWLFFAASTYVWVQYVWHTEKGVCVPTVVLWLLFVYMEAAVRLRDLRHLPFHLDLCRPFAAHCIGYPVVTLGFGFKSYVGYRMRQRKQRDVAKENEFYMQLLQQALPIEQQQTLCHNTCPEKSKETAVLQHENRANNNFLQRSATTLFLLKQKFSNGQKGSTTNDVVTSNGTVHNNSTQVKNNHRKSLDKGERDKSCAEAENKTVNNNKSFSHTNGDIHTELEFIERIGSVNDFDENEAEKDKSSKSYQIKSNSKWSNHQAKENAVNCQRERKNKANKENSEHNMTQKDDYCLRLEADVKRLKIDLQASRQTEQELRCQINSLLVSEKSAKSELCQLQLDNDDLQSKVHGLLSARQMDKQAVSQLERRVQDERRLRSSTEAQLAAERKAKEAATRAISSPPAKGECTESCRARRRDLEAESKQLRRELKIKEERCIAAEREIQCLRQYKESHNDSEILMSALSAMQDKNAHLENSLSAETRIKLDLFSALGEAKRQLEIRENVIRQQEREMEELKGKMAQVLAVMPTETFGPAPSCNTSKLRLADSPTQSTLDPNATAYTPKSSHLAPAAEA